MKICKHCGAEIDDDSRYCTECGGLVNEIKKPESKPEPKSMPKLSHELNSVGFDDDLTDLERFSVKESVTKKQLGILVLDGSGSMNGNTRDKLSKAESVSRSVRELFKRFKMSSVPENFCFAIINYDTKSIVRMNITETANLDTDTDYNPLENLGGQTSIAVGLSQALSMSESFLAQEEEGGVSHSVVIVLMTDGLDMTEEKTLAVAEKIKSNPKITLTSCFFKGINTAEEDITYCKSFLTKVASNKWFREVTNAEELRKFFDASIALKPNSDRM